MNKAVLTSIQPYWVFLIIAKAMGWDVSQEKTAEVRKSFPKDAKWNKKSLIYCSRNRRSFNRIPKQYQPFMAKLLGKVVGEFVCGEIIFHGNISTDKWDHLQGSVHDHHKRLVVERACLTEKELHEYGGKYAWSISSLVVYDKPKELSKLKSSKPSGFTFATYKEISHYPIIRPPQSWCYIEGA